MVRAMRPLRVVLCFAGLIIAYLLLYSLRRRYGHSFSGPGLPGAASRSRREWLLAALGTGQFVAFGPFQLNSASGQSDPEVLPLVTPVELAVATCGERVEGTMTMLKSAVLFAQHPIKVHIFADESLHRSLSDLLEKWPDTFRRRMNASLYPITFPDGQDKEWRHLFKLCASERLFLPSLLKDTDSLIYVDTDVLFLEPVEKLWSKFAQFGPLHLAGLAPEHEDPKAGWYARFARHPFYGRAGVNSGVMLMNLSRLRAASYKTDMSPLRLHWDEVLWPLFRKYRFNITWGDQDLINIIFHFNPEFLYEFDCAWNYRPDHCMYGSACPAAEDKGVSVLHGNRGVLYDAKNPAFRAIYQALRDFPWGGDVVQDLLDPLDQALSSAENTQCGRLSAQFTQGLRRTIVGYRAGWFGRRDVFGDVSKV
uniref:glucoside xylosyltransferase 1-like isoform X1 n=2 Tax=Myxine glutinosa TaxID=7769 RepID=UPI00358E9637